MPLPILLGAAAAVVTASYLLPLIISCITGGITIVVTFFATRAYYKNENAKDSELHSLKKQQIERDNAVHEEVSKIALETGIDIQTLLTLSKEQQQELKLTIQEFMKNLDESDAAAKHLTVIANNIQEATLNAAVQNTNIHLELEQIKNELSNVYNKLKITESNLAQKEAELQKTIEKINYFSLELANHELLDKLNDLENAEHATILPCPNNENLSLKTKNAALAETIESLNKTITKLQQKLANSSDNERSQIQEIQSLIAENKLLTDTISALSDSIESKNTESSKISQNAATTLRMFK